MAALVISLIPCVSIVAIPVAALACLFSFIGLCFAGDNTSEVGKGIAGIVVSLLACGMAVFWLAVMASRQELINFR
jgi:hypothetical protein